MPLLILLAPLAIRLRLVSAKLLAIDYCLPLFQVTLFGLAISVKIDDIGH